MYKWRTYKNHWVLAIPKKGTGYISYEPDWYSSYRWAVNISTEEGTGVRAVASGMEGTLGKAKGEVESILDLIEEY